MYSEVLGRLGMPYGLSCGSWGAKMLKANSTFIAARRRHGGPPVGAGVTRDHEDRSGRACEGLQATRGSGVVAHLGARKKIFASRTACAD
jgi:hypothetical protein